MLTVDELAAEAAAISMVAIEEADRDEFAVALVLQGYEPQRAHQMAYETIADNDGALQMLARQRRRVAWAAALPKGDDLDQLVQDARVAACGTRLTCREREVIRALCDAVEARAALSPPPQAHVE